jgi:hypothetical protein
MTAKTHGLPRQDVSATNIRSITFRAHDVVTAVICLDGSSDVFTVGKGSATTKQKAKDMAATSGFGWLCSEYP